MMEASTPIILNYSSDDYELDNRIYGKNTEDIKKNLFEFRMDKINHSVFHIILRIIDGKLKIITYRRCICGKYIRKYNHYPYPMMCRTCYKKYEKKCKTCSKFKIVTWEDEFDFHCKDHHSIPNPNCTSYEQSIEYISDKARMCPFSSQSDAQYKGKCNICGEIFKGKYSEILEREANHLRVHFGVYAKMFRYAFKCWKMAEKFKGNEWKMPTYLEAKTYTLTPSERKECIIRFIEHFLKKKNYLSEIKITYIIGLGFYVLIKQELFLQGDFKMLHAFF